MEETQAILKSRLRLPAELSVLLKKMAAEHRQSQHSEMLDALWAHVGQPQRIGQSKTRIVSPYRKGAHRG